MSQIQNKEETAFFSNPIKSYVITLGDKMKVTKDKKSGSRFVNIPFEFPGNELENQGVLVVVRVKDDNWNPSDTIKSITIEFK